ADGLEEFVAAGDEGAWLLGGEMGGGGVRALGRGDDGGGAGEEVDGAVVGAEGGVDLAAEGGVAGAGLGEEPLAVGGGGGRGRGSARRGRRSICGWRWGGRCRGRRRPPARRGRRSSGA